MSKIGGLVVRYYRHGRSNRMSRERLEEDADEVIEEEEEALKPGVYHSGFVS